MGTIKRGKLSTLVIVFLVFGLLALQACTAPASPTPAPAPPSQPTAQPAPTKAAPAPTAAASALTQAPAAPTPASGSTEKKIDPEVLKRVFGTTDVKLDPVVAEAFSRIKLQVSQADRDLAYKAWKEKKLDTGHGNLTVAFSILGGDNVWVQLVEMEFILQALTYPEIKNIILQVSVGDITKLTADARAIIAQKPDIWCVEPVFGEAMLPTIKEATAQGITVVTFMVDPNGERGKDYLTAVGADLSGPAREGVRKIAEQTGGKGTVVMLGGPPGFPESDIWQKAAEEEIAAKYPGLKVLGKAPTMFTQESCFQEMSAFLSQSPKIDGILYEFADAFRGAVRAYEAAKRPMDVTVWVGTDEQGLFGDWEKINNPKFKLYYTNGRTWLARLALTAAMESKAGRQVPPRIRPNMTVFEVQKGLYNPELPAELSYGNTTPKEMVEAMFK